MPVTAKATPKAATAAKPKAAPKTISGIAAMTRLGLTRHQLMKLCVLGQIRTQTRPGCWTRYYEEDVDRIAEEIDADMK